MNPVEILYCWQAILVACAAVALTALTKAIIDVRRGYGAQVTDTIKDAATVGKLLRKAEDSVWLNRVVLPGLVVFYGMLIAVTVPARPDVLVEYVEARNIGWSSYLLYASWGAACGQFADYIFSKIKALLNGALNRQSPSGGGD